MATDPPKRYITTNSPTTGQSVFSTAVPDSPTPYGFPGVAIELATIYASASFPHNITDDADLQTYQNAIENPPGIVLENGTLVRTFDLGPGCSTPMHRTISVDCGVIIEGSLVLELDSGEERVLKRGDMFVQRGTMHKWTNPSETETAKMFVTVQPAKEVVIDGKPVGEEGV
ncbi:hypothetical protein FQN52_006949 [Onygenales sp. PD_12]|nr:hypothetical protein FQN52_006949 [Onygenales sp. PD_12]